MYVDKKMLAIIVVVLSLVYYYITYIPNTKLKQLNAEQYNTLRVDYDYYLCLDNARLFYESMWKGHCIDAGLLGYCTLSAELRDNTRNHYEKQKDLCYAESKK